MTKVSRDAALNKPPKYPGGIDFGILLAWHLNSWGTHCDGNDEKNEGLWDLEEFAALIVGSGGNHSPEAPAKSLKNWMAKGKAPPSDTRRAIRILETLFGDKQCFDGWRNDLIAAWEHWYRKPLFDGAGNGPHRKPERFNRRGQHKHLDNPNLIAAPSLPPFTHNQLHKLQAEPTSLIKLLQTDVRATTLVGRADQLAMIRDWLTTPQSIAVKCIIGGAGSGKTRLAIEACERAEIEGWFATFLSSTELQQRHGVEILAAWTPSQPTLIVVDYAANSVSAIKRWFDVLALRRDPVEQKLRILLLERHAQREGGWWADLVRPDTLSHSSAIDVIGTELPYELRPLNNVQDRRALLTEIMAKAAPLFDPPRDMIAPPAAGENSWFDQRLASNRVDNEPLYLIMAGIRAVECGAPAALAMNRLELAQWVAEIEAERLRDFALARGFTDQGKLLLHVAACVTVQNGCDPSDLPELIASERIALGISSNMDDETVANILGDFLPVGNKVAPIRPDLIGEILSLSVIDGGLFRKEEVSRKIILRCAKRNLLDTVGTLIRCACDLAEGSSKHDSVQYILEIVTNICDYYLYKYINFSIPQDTLALSEVAVIMSNIMSEIRSDMIKQEYDKLQRDEDFMIQYVQSLINNSVRLSKVGRHEEALNEAKKALVQCRELNILQIDVDRTDLSHALIRIGISLGDLGRSHEAVTALEEALAIRRQLAILPSEATDSGLAHVLIAMSNNLSVLRHPSEALESALEALEIYRRLSTAQPDKFSSDLAASLITVANCLSKLGRDDLGLSVAEEALTLYRQLAAESPDAFTPHLAATLSNLSNLLSEFDAGAAITALKESLSIQRRLATDRPDTFAPDLANMLNNFAHRLSELGHNVEALAASDEALTLQRQLTSALPEAFTPALARAHSTRGLMLERNNRISEAALNYHVAVSTLVPYLFADTATYGDIIIGYIRHYIRLAVMSSLDTSNLDLDMNLIEKIREHLSRNGFMAP